MINIGKASIIGLDIGFHSIKIVEIGSRRKEQFVKRLAVVPTGNTPGMSEDERKERLVGLLQSAWKELGIRNKKVHSVIPGRSVFYRPLKIPVVTGDRLEKIVRYEAKQQIPFSLDQILLDYHVFGGSGGELEGTLFAVRKDTIEDHVRLLARAGLRPDLIDVSTICIFNATRAIDREPDEVVAIVNIGATTTDIIIEHQNVLKFSRSAPKAGNDLTAALQNVTGRSFEECEDLKVRFGHLSSATDVPDIELPPEWTETLTDFDIVDALDNSFDQIVMEIRRSIDYYIAQPDGMAVSKLLISGGTTALPGAVESLEDKLGIPVERIDPTTCSPVAMGDALTPETTNSALVTCGLAVPQTAQHRVSMNFIPDSIRNKQEFEQKRGYIVIQGLFLAMVIFTSAMYLHKQIQLRNLLYEDHISAVIRIDDGKIGREFAAVLKQQDEMFKRFEMLQQIALRRGKIVDNLLEIVKITPTSYISLSSINIEHDKILIKGNASDDMGIKSFMEELRLSPFIEVMKNVTPEGSGNAFTFEVSELHEPNEKEYTFYSNIRPRRLQVPDLRTFRFGLPRDEKLVQVDFYEREPIEELFAQMETALEVLVDTKIEYTQLHFRIFNIREDVVSMFLLRDEAEVMQVYHGERKLQEMAEEYWRQRREARRSA